MDYSRDREGQTILKFCGRHLWMFPIYCYYHFKMIEILPLQHLFCMHSPEDVLNAISYEFFCVVAEFLRRAPEIHSITRMAKF